jgi:hypothetical protein
MGPEVAVAKSIICISCKSLWREYAHAIDIHVESVRQSHSGALNEDSVTLMECEWQERESLRGRQKARKALIEHQAAHLAVNGKTWRKVRSEEERDDRRAASSTKR